MKVAEEALSILFLRFRVLTLTYPLDADVKLSILILRFPSRSLARGGFLAGAGFQSFFEIHRYRVYEGPLLENLSILFLRFKSVQQSLPPASEMRLTFNPLFEIPRRMLWRFAAAWSYLSILFLRFRNTIITTCYDGLCSFNPLFEIQRKLTEGSSKWSGLSILFLRFI